MNPMEILGGSVGESNYAVAAAAAAMLPVCAELDAFISLNLGPLEAALSAQFSASLDLSLNAALAITNPFLSAQLVLQALIALQGALQASLTLPSISLSLDAGIAAAAELAIALEIKLGILNAAINALLALKIGLAELAGQIAGSLTTPGVVLLEFGGDASTTLAQNGADIAAKFATGLNIDSTVVLPTDISFGYILATRVPAAKVGLDFILRGI